MYRSYYELKTSPFQITSDPKFLWLGETHREALATLKYGVYENKSFLLLTGDVGCGKTTLINSFVNRLNDSVIHAVLSDPGLTLLDLLNHIAFLFGLEETFPTKGAFIIGFTRFLHNAHDQGKRVLLIIDEAQRLDKDILEEICMLSNIEKQDAKLINIFFVGQNEFREMVRHHPNRSLQQKLTFNCQVSDLDEADLKVYLAHRLKVAGAKRMLFDKGAIQTIYRYSGGNPRLTNIICDLALLTGFVQEKSVVDAQIIMECVMELQLEPLVHDDPEGQVESPADISDEASVSDGAASSVPESGMARKDIAPAHPVRSGEDAIEGAGSVGDDAGGTKTPPVDPGGEDRGDPVKAGKDSFKADAAGGSTDDDVRSWTPDTEAEVPSSAPLPPGRQWNLMNQMAQKAGSLKRLLILFGVILLCVFAGLILWFQG